MLVILRIVNNSWGLGIGDLGLGIGPIFQKIYSIINNIKITNYRWIKWFWDWELGDRVRGVLDRDYRSYPIPNPFLFYQFISVPSRYPFFYKFVKQYLQYYCYAFSPNPNFRFCWDLSSQFKLKSVFYLQTYKESWLLEHAEIKYNYMLIFDLLIII